MAMTEIEREFDLTLDTLGPDWFARFAKLGIPTRVTFGLRSLCGVGRVIPHSSGLFEFHEDGTEALVLAEGEPDLPGWHWLDDLVAFMPEDPGCWWLRRGQIDLLGGYNLDQPWRLEPTLLSATPLEWLRAGAQGVCVLDWALDPLHELLGGPALVVLDQALRDRLQRRTMEVALEALNNTVTEERLETRNAAA